MDVSELQDHHCITLERWSWGALALQQAFWGNLMLSSFCDDSCLTYHSAVMVTAITHTSESCRNLFAQKNKSRVLTHLQFWLLCSVNAMPVNKMLFQKLNQFNRNWNADFRFSRNFWFLVQLPGEMFDSPLLRTPMKVAHIIYLKNKMSLKKFQVIWQP